MDSNVIEIPVPVEETVGCSDTKFDATEQGIDAARGCAEIAFAQSDRASTQRASAAEENDESAAQFVKLWEDGYEIYGLTREGYEARIRYGWWKGCAGCGAFEEEIKEILEFEGSLEACRFAMEHLIDGDQGFLCDWCRKDGDAECHDEATDESD